jgi:hypothetical protein
MSAAAIREVTSTRNSRANAELIAKYEAAVIRADKAEGEIANLRRQLGEIRDVVNRETAEFRSEYDERAWS